MKQTTIKAWRQQHIEQSMEKLGITRKEYKRFLILGNKLHRIYEYACNGYTGQYAIYNGNTMLNAYTDTQYEKDTEPLNKKIRAMAKERGLYVFFQTDPRGATIYLDTKPINQNRYNDANCIY